MSARAAALDVDSPTGAAEALYLDRYATLDEFEQALPRLDGQSDMLVGVAGRLTCLDYLSRSDVLAGLYVKLLDALDGPLDPPLSRREVGRFLGELVAWVSRPLRAAALGIDGNRLRPLLVPDLVLLGR